MSRRQNIDDQVDRLLGTLTRRYRSLERQLRNGRITAQDAFLKALQLDDVLRRLILIQRERDQLQKEASVG